MPIQQFTFSETSPPAPGTAASSNTVTGSPAAGLPAGVIGLLDDYESIDVAAELKGATGGTLAVYLQLSSDLVNWYDTIAWPSLTSGASAIVYRSPLSQATNTTVTSVVGKGLTPALSNTPTATTPNVVNGAFNCYFRLVMVAGSGTSAGAAVVVRVTAQRSRIREAGES